MPSRERSPEELAEDIAEIKDGLAQLSRKLDHLPFVRQDVYEARHTALRNEVALEMASIRLEQGATKSMAESALQTARWALGIFLSSVVGFIVLTVLTNRPG